MKESSVQVKDVVEIVMGNANAGFTCDGGSSRSINNNYKTVCDAWFAIDGVVGVVIYRSNGTVFAFMLVRHPLKRYGGHTVYQIGVDEAMEFIRKNEQLKANGFSAKNPIESMGELLCTVKLTVFKEEYSYGRPLLRGSSHSTVVVFRQNKSLVAFIRSDEGIYVKKTAAFVKTFYEEYLKAAQVGSALLEERKKEATKYLRKHKNGSETMSVYMYDVPLPEEVRAWMERICLFKSV